MATFLLIKEHLDTGLKYLCKHVASSFFECQKYKGSGTYWKRHLKKHGTNIKTTCLFVTEDEKEFRNREASNTIESYTYKMIWDRLQNDKEWRYI
jgi:hypothetical protein